MQHNKPYTLALHNISRNAGKNGGKIDFVNGDITTKDKPRVKKTKQKTAEGTEKKVFSPTNPYLIITTSSHKPTSAAGIHQTPQNDRTTSPSKCHRIHKSPSTTPTRETENSVLIRYGKTKNCLPSLAVCEFSFFIRDCDTSSPGNANE